jgi:hypothetical protein
MPGEGYRIGAVIRVTDFVEGGPATLRQRKGFG